MERNNFFPKYNKFQIEKLSFWLLEIWWKLNLDLYISKRSNSDREKVRIDVQFKSGKRYFFTFIFFLGIQVISRILLHREIKKRRRKFSKFPSYVLFSYFSLIFVELLRSINKNEDYISFTNIETNGYKEKYFRNEKHRKIRFWNDKKYKNFFHICWNVSIF